MPLIKLWEMAEGLRLRGFLVAIIRKYGHLNIKSEGWKSESGS